MKFYIRSLFLFMLFLSFLDSTAQSSPSSGSENNDRYFDESNTEISKEKFIELRNSMEYLDVPGDSANHKRLVYRYVEGKILHVERVYQMIDSLAAHRINYNKAVVTIYYPGIDECNKKMQHRRVPKKDLLRDELDNIDPEINLLRIYKNDMGLKKSIKKKEWHQDPNQFFEKNFFPHHYPCGSFVVFAPDGRYFAYLGEYPFEYITEATRMLNK
jgi:hypothetical protein